VSLDGIRGGKRVRDRRRRSPEKTTLTHSVGVGAQSVHGGAKSCRAAFC